MPSANFTAYSTFGFEVVCLCVVVTISVYGIATHSDNSTAFIAVLSGYLGVYLPSPSTAARTTQLVNTMHETLQQSHQTQQMLLSLMRPQPQHHVIDIPEH